MRSGGMRPGRARRRAARGRGLARLDLRPGVAGVGRRGRGAGERPQQDRDRGQREPEPSRTCRLRVVGHVVSFECAVGFHCRDPLPRCRFCNPRANPRSSRRSADSKGRSAPAEVRNSGRPSSEPDAGVPVRRPFAPLRLRARGRTVGASRRPRRSRRRRCRRARSGPRGRRRRKTFRPRRAR